LEPDPSPRAPAVWSLDDAALVAAVREGDEDAADALYERLQAVVEGSVRRLLGPGDPEVEDCVQTAFVEIVRAVDQYRGESSLERWASTIAAHVVFKAIRRRRTERRIFERGGVPERPEVVSTGRRLVARDLARRIRVELDAVALEKAEAFLLHDVLGFDLREVASALNVTVAAAQKRLVRGRAEIHARLAKDTELAAALVGLRDEA
jgi:RNA polymerase sigma-70 factor, ECF subfamily